MQFVYADVLNENNDFEESVRIYRKLYSNDPSTELLKRIVTRMYESMKNKEVIEYLKEIEIAKYDKNGDVAQALILISQQLLKNRANQEEAVRLAGQLEKMALSLSSVKPAKAQRLATAAVTAEVALVSRLVNYNDYLKQLFEILRSKFDGSASYSNGRVEELIKKINEEMEVINDLDRRFNEALWELDNLDL